MLAHPGGRSCATTWDEVAASGAEVLIVAPCGFDGDAALEQLEQVLARPELAALPAVVNGGLLAVDGDAFIVRPGPRLVDGVEHLARCCIPACLPANEQARWRPEMTDLADGR